MKKSLLMLAAVTMVTFTIYSLNARAAEWVFNKTAHNAAPLNIRYTGTVTWYNPVNGNGFISPDSGGRDIYVHVSASEGLLLLEGQRVSYEVEVTLSGRPVAVNVIIL